MNAKRDTSWIPEDYKQYASLLTENVIILNEAIFIDKSEYDRLFKEINDSDLDTSNKKSLTKNIDRLYVAMRDLREKVKTDSDDITNDKDHKRNIIIGAVSTIIALIMSIITISLAVSGNISAVKEVVMGIITILVSAIGIVSLIANSSTDNFIISQFKKLAGLTPKLDRAISLSKDDGVKKKLTVLRNEISSVSAIIEPLTKNIK